MRHFTALIIAAGLIASPVSSFTVEQMWAEFDARQLTHDEKRFLQMGLALGGAYNALIDGAWGMASQRGLEAWALDNGLDLPIENWEVVLLALENLARFERDGWEQRYFAPIDMSFAVPAGQLRAEPAGEVFLNYAHTASSLRYSLTLGDLQQVSRIHDYALGAALAGSKPYILRRDAVRITSVEQPEGRILYARSDLRRGGWATILLSAETRDRALLHAVSGSLVKGRSAVFDLPARGRISEGIGALATIMDEAEGVPPGDGVAAMREAMTLPPASDRPAAPPAGGAAVTAAAPPSALQPVEPRRIGTGTGFRVSEVGHLLTNAHVVEGCASVRIGAQEVQVLATDDGFDLALLLGEPAPAAAIAAFARRPAPLNSDLTIAGYPLNGLLAGLNVTRGSVTGLKGLSGDATTMQISAPVQPGNSGGPVVDASGSVVGVVVSKLDAKLIADATGDIPQNINFAIRGEIAKLFLFQSGVEPVLAEEGLAPLDPVEAARRLEQMTRLVECYGFPD